MKSIAGVEYTKTGLLGQGAFGAVSTVFSENGGEFALKAFERDEDTTDIDIGILREISVLKAFMGNKNGIMGLVDLVVDEETDEIGLIMRKYSSDLDKAIDGKYLSLKQKKNIARKLLEAVAFMHSNGMIHRDIKPENIMLDDEFNPVLADFSLSKVFDSEILGLTHTAEVCTCAYRSPEVVGEKGYGFPADVWSVGVTLFELFSSERFTEVFSDNKVLEILEAKKAKMTNGALGLLLKGLLEVNPDNRWTCEQALQSELFNITPRFPKVWKPTSIGQISQNVKNLAKLHETDNATTAWAAQTYINRSGCNPSHCMILACKMYEAELPDTDDDLEFAESEMQIFRAMNYNLFV